MLEETYLTKTNELAKLQTNGVVIKIVLYCIDRYCINDRSADWCN